MINYCYYLLVLGLFNIIKCELSLKIIKNTGDFYTPVSSVVEEKAGANFSLYCDLVSSETNINYYDYQISWVKQTQINDLRFWKEGNSLNNLNNKQSQKFYSILTSSEVNKAVKHFNPLKSEDKGKYICVSLKYDLYKSVEVIVRDEIPNFIDRPFRETNFCSDQMFQCSSNDICIIHHYICDGKPDCKDGSDESEETCHGDPCKDKLICDDGRCIPTTWCCDRHHDPNCTVTNRPKCCQILSESYEELEYGLPNINHNNNGARYLFISVCILSILFFIVLLILILSKVVTFAKKAAFAQVREQATIENIALRNCRDYRDISDPLLFPLRSFNRSLDEQPPPYMDAVSVLPNTQDCRLNLNEPPPPYTSREMLNID